MSRHTNQPRSDVVGGLIRNVVYPLWALKNGSVRLKYLAQLEQSQYWSRELIEANQLALFQRVFSHAYESCPYYRRKFQLAGVAPADIRSLRDIDQVPVITKDEIQENRELMVSTLVDRGSLIPDMTGGSTGSPMQFYYDKDRQDSREAAALRHDRWSGWNIGNRRAILWGAPQDTKLQSDWKGRARERLLERRIILDASSIDDKSMSSFLEELLRYQPAIIQAYANTLGLFARYVHSRGGTDLRPKAIITSAEVLTHENRRLIEDVFSCRVYNRYGSREVSVIASECSEHQGMHINAENLLVEVLVDGRSTVDQDGEIVITDLRNLAMPMIRYRIKDVGRIKREPCSCSRGLPLMELSGGRVTDFLTATNGSKVSGIVIATYVITNLRGIRQIQFMQAKAGTVEVNLVRGPDCSEQTLKELEQRLHRFLGTDMRVHVNFLTQIPMEKSGKYRFSISSL